MEIIVAICWLVLLFERPQSPTQTALGWAVAGGMFSLAMCHIALLRLDWTPALAYLSFVLTLITALLLAVRAISTARHAGKTAAKIGAFALTIVALLYSSVKLRMHSKFVFDVRRSKYEDDLAHYLALEGRPPSDDDDDPLLSPEFTKV